MTEETKKHIKEKLKLVPPLPGSYQMKNKDGIIIYVGKAKNLKNRVKSYFTGTVTGKTAMLVEDIVDFEYIVTSSELESLILEITLIKKYDPKYNILLKDDKSYPYIELTNERYPRLKIVRNVNRKRHKSKLYGPYPNVTAARKTVNVIHRLYPLRKCETLKKEVCLYYHLHECLGYCQKKVDPIEVERMIQEITSFLKGNSDIITKRLQEDMQKASEAMNYEKALELKNMLDDIEITLTKQKIDLHKNYNFDLFACVRHNNYFSVQVFFIREGLLFGRHNDIFTVIDEEGEELLQYIIKFYEKNNLLPKEIVVPSIVDKELLGNYLGIKVTSPVRGELRQLLSMAEENCKIALDEKEENLKKQETARSTAQEELMQLLGLEKLSRIETFDNSHLFGTFYVGAMVVFEDFLPNKNEYRKFKITTDAKDDLGAMREVLYRRYYRVLMENLVRPDLILVDGGETQVAIAKEIIDSLHLEIPIAGLKKDDHHRTSILVNENLEEIEIDHRSNLFLFLSKMQEEVHRFAITYHREIKSKGALSSLLDVVPGIGAVRKKELLRKFGSLKKMKEATLSDLEEVLSKDVAQNLYHYLRELE